METSVPWLARCWLPYLLAGLGWVTFGAAVLGMPRGLGLVLVGLACLGLGLGLGGYGARRRRSHGYRLFRWRPRS